MAVRKTPTGTSDATGTNIYDAPQRAAAPSQLARLGAEFRPGEHKSRTQGGQTLTYVSIDATIKRLNEVLGADWSTEARTSLTAIDDGKYLAMTELSLKATIDGTTKLAYGVGAMKNNDPDMAAKTALAEAIKKAGHSLGVALYLWDAETRKAVEKKAKLANGSVAALKQEVYSRAKEILGTPSPTLKQVGEVFSVDPADLTDAATLRAILEEQGQL